MSRETLPEDLIDFLPGGCIESKSLIIVAEAVKVDTKVPYGKGKSRHRRHRAIAKGTGKPAYCYDDIEVRSKM